MAILIPVLKSELLQVFGKLIRLGKKNKVVRVIYRHLYHAFFTKFTHKNYNFSQVKDLIQYNSFSFQQFSTKPDMESCGKTIKNKNYLKKKYFLQSLHFSALHDIFQMPLKYISSSKAQCMQARDLERIVDDDNILLFHID